MRVEGWESLLDAYVRDTAKREFVWGERDCALWAADWVALATGEDHTTSWRGRYATETGAARLMRRRAFASVEDIADYHLTRCPVPMARRGDLILSDAGCLGICDGRLSHFITKDGHTDFPTLSCKQAWRVG